MWINHISIATAQGASNKIDCDAMETMLTTQQSFFYVVLQGAMTIKDLGKGRMNTTPTQQSFFMLSFAGCNNDHIVPRSDQQCEYAEVKYGKNAGYVVYIIKGMYVAMSEYREYAKDSVYIAEGQSAEEAVFAK
jgi:hypothetical protein